jgi:hypothetical protein
MIYVKVIPGKGRFSGFAQGQCEYYNMVNHTIMIGTFRNSMLIGRNDMLVQFTDTSFTCFVGAYTNNQPNGNVVVYEYTGADKLSTSTLLVDKINATYNSGTETARTSTEQVQVQLTIEYKNTCIVKFSLVERPV